MGWMLLLIASLVAPGESRALGSDLDALRPLIRAGKWADASAVSRSIGARIAHLAPLEVLDGHALRAPAAGLGIYEVLDDGQVRGEELFLYAQVRNHGLRRQGQVWELFLVSDLIILDAAGAEIARDEGFGESRFSARARHRDTFVNIAVRVKGLPSGRYTARLLIRDRVKASSRPIDIPFQIP